MKPIVSVIVPVYNVAQYLPQCLDSLINQTFQNFEIICFNDASTDNSLKILEEYQRKDDRIKIINSTVNVRQGGGRNRAIKASKGEFLMFVDSDDWVRPNFIERLYLTALQTHSEIVTSDYYESNRGVLNEKSTLGKNIHTNNDCLKELILKNGCRIWTSIFKKNLFIDNDLFFPEHIFYEDNAIAPALFLAASSITKIDDNLYIYRNDNISTTRKRNNLSFFDRLKTSKLMLANIKRIDVEGNYKQISEEIFIRLFYINTVFGALRNFDKFPVDIITSAKNELLDTIEYSTIKRVINNLNFKQRQIIRLSMKYPYLLDYISWINRKIFDR